MPPGLRLGQVKWTVLESGPVLELPRSFELKLTSDGLVGYLERVVLDMLIEPLQQDIQGIEALQQDNALLERDWCACRLSVSLSWSSVSAPLALLRSCSTPPVSCLSSLSPEVSPWLHRGVGPLS